MGVSTDLKPNYAANELNKYSSTTTTSVSTTTVTVTTTTPFFNVSTSFDEARKSIIEADTEANLVKVVRDAQAAVSKARKALAEDPSNAELMAAFQKANEALVQAKRDFDYFEFYVKQKAIDDTAAASAAAAAGGLPIIPILAGAGAVAFENPMYDDPSNNDRANPV